MTNYALGQLRHLYQLMVSGHVTDTAEAARGLLGPAIEELEAACAPDAVMPATCAKKGSKK